MPYRSTRSHLALAFIHYSDFDTRITNINILIIKYTPMILSSKCKEVKHVIALEWKEIQRPDASQWIMS